MPMPTKHFIMADNAPLTARDGACTHEQGGPDVGRTGKNILLDSTVEKALESMQIGLTATDFAGQEIAQRPVQGDRI